MKELEIVRPENYSEYLKNYIKDKDYFQFQYYNKYQCVKQNDKWVVARRNKKSGKIFSTTNSEKNLIQLLISKICQSEDDLILDEKYKVYPKY